MGEQAITDASFRKRPRMAPLALLAGVILLEGFYGCVGDSAVAQFVEHYIGEIHDEVGYSFYPTPADDT